MRRTLTGLAALALVTGVAACSNAATPGPPAGTGTGAPAPTPASSLTRSEPPTSSADQEAVTISRRAVCVGPVPTELRQSIEAGWQVPIEGGKFWAMAVSGSRVYGTGGPDNAIYLADTSTHTVNRIADVPGDAAGTGWMAASDSALVWLNYDSPQDPTRWTLFLAKADGSHVRRVAGSAPDQADGEGRATQPALSGDRLAWTEWDPAKGQSSLKVMTVSDRKVRTIATGNLYPPVVAGGSFVWSEKNQAGSWSLEAVDATTLKAISMPDGLPLSEGVAHLAGTKDRLMWGSEDYKTLNVWNQPKHEVLQFKVPQGDDHVFQFMHPTGEHLTWDAAWPYSVMNLNTGALYDVGKDVSVTANEGLVAVSWMSRKGDGKGSDRGPARLSVINEDDLPATQADHCRT